MTNNKKNKKNKKKTPSPFMEKCSCGNHTFKYVKTSYPNKINIEYPICKDCENKILNIYEEAKKKYKREKDRGDTGSDKESGSE